MRKVNTMKERVFSMLLVACMVMSMIPFNAFAIVNTNIANTQIIVTSAMSEVAEQEVVAGGVDKPSFEMSMANIDTTVNTLSLSLNEQKAGTIEGEGYSFTNGVLTVTSNEGTTNWRSNESIGLTAVTSVVVDDAVTSFGNNAFYECSSLSTVTINESSQLQTIGDYAFYNCSNLSTVTINESSQLQTIGEYAFAHCSSLTSITIPKSITSIKKSAFNGCSKLETVTIDENSNLQTIEPYAFFNCSSLTTVTIGEGSKLQTIGIEAFHLCSSLKYITIPDTVTSIETHAFKGCSSLTSIIIPDSVTSIGDNAFNDCSELTTVTIGANSQLQTIGETAFENCSKLKEIYIPSTVTSINDIAFYNCSELSTVTIGANSELETIGYRAFMLCSSLSSITIPDSVISIGSFAFFNCSELATVTFSEGSKLQKIDSYAFSECSKLKEISIPATVTTIGDNVFENCPSLIGINVEEGNLEYISKNGILFDINETTLIRYPEGKEDVSYTIPDTITSIGVGAFNSCDKLTSIIIPDSVTTIEDRAFQKCSSLTTITIPKDATSIGSRIFENCSSLSEINVVEGNSKYSAKDGVLFDNTEATLIKYPEGKDDDTYTIPDTVTTISDYAFAYCNNLVSMDIPENVTSIGNYAFRDCSKLASITIPDGVTTIEGRVFDDCSSLDAVYFKGKYPSLEDEGMQSIPIEATIYVNEAEDGSWQIYEGRGGTVTVPDIAYGDTIAVKQDGATFIKGRDYTVSSGEYTDVGAYRLYIAGIGFYSTLISSNGYYYHIKQSTTDFDGGITFDKTEGVYTYGDTITVKVTPKATGEMVTTRTFGTPVQNQMALYVRVNSVDKQITEPKPVTSGEELTFLIDTVDKHLSIGSNTIVAKYIGNNNMLGHEETATIMLNQKPLTWDNGVAENKVYDGTNIAIKDTEAMLIGVETDDKVTATNGTIVFVGANVSDTTTVLATDYLVVGDDIGYYNLVNAQPNFDTAEITAKDITIQTLSIDDKNYDGTNTATVTDVQFEGLVLNENLSLGEDYTAVATFDDNNVGNNKAVTANIVLENTIVANNYNLTNGVNFQYITTGSIVKGESQTGAISVTNGSGMTAKDFEYGDIITVTFAPKLINTVTSFKSKSLADSAQSKTAELWIDDTKIKTHTNTDIIEGTEVIFSIDTKDIAKFPFSLFDGTSRTLTVKWGGDDNLNASSDTAMITLNPKKVGDFHILGGVQDIDYDYTDATADEVAKLTIKSDATITISNADKDMAIDAWIEIASSAKNANITFDGVYIDTTNDRALQNYGDTASITVLGDNILESENFAMAVGSNLKLKGTGTLEITSGSYFIPDGNSYVLAISNGVTINGNIDGLRVDATDDSEKYYYNDLAVAIQAINDDSSKKRTVVIEHSAESHSDAKLPIDVELVINNGAEFIFYDDINASNITLTNQGTITNHGLIDVGNNATLNCSDGIITGNTPKGEGTFIKMSNNLETVSQDDIIYGTAVEPDVGYMTGKVQNGEDIVYTYSMAQDGEYSSTMPTKVGIYWVKATSSNAELVADKEVIDMFEITKKSLTADMITDIPDFEYTGREIEPTLIVTDGTPSIITTDDYTVSYTDNTAIGTAKATITAKSDGNYKETAFKTFEITKPSIANATVTLGENDFTYTGASQIPNVTVKLGDTTLPSNEYDIIYTNTNGGVGNNTNAGTITITIKASASGSYSGEAKEKPTYIIKMADQTNFAITEVLGKKYADDPFELTTTGGNGNGAVRYEVIDGDAITISGNKVTIVGVGTVMVKATKVSDGNYNDVTATMSITIAKADAPVLIFPTASSITYGQKLSASILSKTSDEYGTYAWTDSDIVPTVTNSGYNVTFTQTNDNYETVVDTTEDVSVTVAKVAPSVNVNIAISGESGDKKATLSATVNKVGDGVIPTGTVTFTDTTSQSAIIATSNVGEDGIATYEWTSLLDQVYKITATYDGDSNYETVMTTEQSFDTRKQSQTGFMFIEIGEKIYGDDMFELSSTGGESTGNVTFISSDPSVISINGTTATIHKAGHTTIIATKAEDENYNAMTISETVTVGKKSISIKADDMIVLQGNAMPEFTYTVTPALVANDRFTTAPIITTTATDTDAVAIYPINISGGVLLNADSYHITYIAGELHIILDTQELENSIKAATDLKADIVVRDSSPSSVTKGIQFVSTSVMSTFEVAVTQAEIVLNTATTNSQIIDAIEALKKAEVIFKDAIQIGTKSSNSGGGSGTGSVPSTPSNEIDSREEVSIDDIEDILADNESLIVNGDNDIEATFDTDAMEAILKKVGKDIEIIIEEATDSMLNDRQQITVGDRPVFNFQVMVDGEVITDFEGGRVRITFPYELKNEEEAENLVIYYIDSEGNIIEKIDVEYDEDKEEIIFDLTHFSIYMLAYEEVLENPFSDVSESDWYYEDVMYVYENSIMSGVEESIFAPTDFATRAMIWTVLARMDGIDTNGGEEWYSKAMEWAMENEVSDGTNLDGYITREQLVTMLFRYNNDNAMTLQTMLEQFEDSNMLSEYAVSAMEWAVANSIINGSDNKLNPQGNATRAEIAAIMHRFMMME